MAVYERAYRRYAGPLSPEWSRFLILPRYAFKEMFSSKLFSAFYALCFVAPVFFMVVIYLRHNLSALTVLEIPEGVLPNINATFFLTLQTIQGFFTFLLAVAVGPSLISPDLSNNALALYLSRPISRSEYILGKMSVLVVLMSLITWCPGLLLFLLQWYLGGTAWFTSNLHIAPAIFLASWISILLLSLLALAIAAWLKRKLLARVSTLAVFFVLGGFGSAINGIFQTRWGDLIDLDDLMATVWARLYGIEWTEGIPLWSAWASLVLICCVCLGLLARKVKAYEVVR
jgi:ABC-2 type transport system permease protein